MRAVLRFIPQWALSLLWISLFCAFGLHNSPASAQDTTWQQVLGGWVDGVYYENLFLGGSYFTRISLADIDNDGDLDMFYGGGDCGSLVYFENLGNAQGPVFELRYEEFPGLMNAPSVYGGTVDVDFADLDNDGDLDAAYSAQLDIGGSLSWNDGTPEEPYFVYRYPHGPYQGQSNVTLTDIDGDGDYDYFSGYGYRERQMYFAENVGSAEVPQFEHRTYHYQDIDFGLPFNFDFGDIDEDGDYDLIVCKHGGNIGYYENSGTPAEPNFVLVTDDFLPDRDTTDWMETPELADIDGDGDLDLFLAGAFAHLYYFENLGVSENPQFIERYDTTFFYVIPHMGGTWLGNSVDIDADGDDDLAPGITLFLNESMSGQIRFARVDNALPFVAGTFADMDADGDYDYIIPAGAYALGYYENLGDPFWPVWDSRRELFPPDGRLYYIFSVTAGDLDNDGDLDLLVGHEHSTRPSYYRNDGSPETYDFVYDGELYLPEWEFRGAFEALLEDIDDDDDLDLLVGDIRNSYIDPIRLIFYLNDGTPEEPSWTFVTDDFQNVVRDHRNGSMGPCLSDVDNDGDKDLVFSAHLGLMLFLNPSDPTGIEEPRQSEYGSAADSIEIQSFPNPSNSTVAFSFTVFRDIKIEIDILNILGQVVSEIFSGKVSKGIHTYDWNVSDRSSGVYFVRVSTEKGSFFSKFTVMK